MKLTKIYGLHSAQAALDYSAENILQVWVDSHRQDKRLSEIIKQVSDLGLNTEKADRKKLDRLAGGPNHQGIVIEIEMPAAKSEDQLKTDILNITTPPLFLVLDNVQDPHNLGACLRTADATGVNGVIITKDNATGITPTVCKVASGAAETVPVYQITNLARTLRWLKDQGLWILGAAGDGDQTIYQADLKVPMALVIGAEGKGLRRLTREECDMMVKLPMLGKIESLNLSVATGVFLYEVVRQRMI